MENFKSGSRRRGNEILLAHHHRNAGVRRSRAFKPFVFVGRIEVIDEKKLCNMFIEDWDREEVLGFIAAAMEVVRAAQAIKLSMTGRHDWKGDPPSGHYIVSRKTLRELMDSIAPFSEQEKEK